MKKRVLIVFILVLSTAIFSFQRESRIRKRILKAKHLNLISPENEWKYDQSPVTVHFKWVHPGDVDNFDLFIEHLVKGKWEPDFIKSNLRVNHYSIQLNIKRDFRWKVEAKRGNIVLYRSVFRYCRYVGELPPTPQFYPVPFEPKKDAVLKNYPRNVVFKWLHSTDPNYRRYQIQIDMFHAGAQQWGSELRKPRFLVDQVTLKTFYRYKYPADRKGRWRVRGMDGGKRFTPWSEWRYFVFRARH